MTTINAGVAMLRVLEDWGIDHIYGIPGGSFNSTMDALFAESSRLRYIQVRHEEVGALAAVADAKLTGQVGVVFGSAGPGATHLIQGLYDAAMDHAPLVALLGQVAHTAMNTYAFQELNENPIFADVAVYNRTVMSPEQLPVVVDHAIKEAYQHRGVAVVTIPVDLGMGDIEDSFRSSASTRRDGLMLPADDDIAAALDLLAAAQRPYLYIGQGLRGQRATVEEFAKHFALPVGASSLAKGIVPDHFRHFMGMAGRVGMKPGVEVLAASDLIIFAGSDFPFGQAFFPRSAKFIHINTDQATFGRRHPVDVAILGDAGVALEEMRQRGASRAPDVWLAAAQANKDEWEAWCHSFDRAEPEQGLLRPEPVFAAINAIATDDAIFVTDVGNVTVNSVRHLACHDRQQFMTSGLFATMGNAWPGGIGAQLSFPQRQVFTLAGDGGAAMMLPALVTQVQYRLPIINVVFTNRALGFIEAEQEDTRQTKFGVYLDDIDFAATARALGAEGWSVRNLADLEAAFTAAAHLGERPIVIDVKQIDARPLPVEQLKLDPEKYSSTEITAFRQRYQADGLTAFRQILERAGA
ncbi:MAG: pyruvate oxidase [Propionibacteriaceae bacterium]|jgi:pyruvate oxidase|nr:pyruvate oxidase [Propionibacteriaceae bacterium]